MKSESNTGPDQRRVMNFLIAPSGQLRLAIIAVGICLLFFFGFFGFQIWMFSALIGSLLGSVPESSALTQLASESVHWAWVAFGAMAIVFAAVFVATMVVLSHRIYGPAHAFRRHLAALARGEFGHRTHLRKGDEFGELAAELNALSEALEEKAIGSR